MADPNEVDAPLSRLLLKLSVQAVERLAGHMLPHHDHVGIEPLDILPKLVDETLVAAVGLVAHDHVHVEVGHVLIRLLVILGLVFLAELLLDDHREHIGQRNNAPTVDHPIKLVDTILRLNAPDDAAVAVLGSHHGLVLVALADELHYLVVNRREVLGAAAVTHVVCVVIQREHGTEELRVLGGVDLEPFPTVTGGLIDPLYTLKIGVPIPLYTHLLLYPSDALFHILGCVV